MNKTEIVAELSRLVSLEIDAVHAYGAAIDGVGGSSTVIGAELALLKLEHQRHALSLYDLILGLGHNPPDVEPDVQGVVIGALTPPRRRMNPEEIIEAMRGNEQLTNSVYAKALAKPWPPAVRAVIEAARADEQSHLDWIERALARRLWESAFGGVAHP
jgi:hypothetical protein